MIVALDSNILIDIRQDSPSFVEGSIEALRSARMTGILVICNVVYTEVCTNFHDQAGCDSFLKNLGIGVEPLDQASSFLASRYWLNYLKSGGKRNRILPDFLIAAHATRQADALLSRDRGFYRKHFPKLRLIEPAKPSR